MALNAQILLITNSFGGRQAEAMLFLFKDRLSASGGHTTDLETKPAVIRPFLQFGLEFSETEILADLPRHWY
jgi:hypothetical protein